MQRMYFWRKTILHCLLTLCLLQSGSALALAIYSSCAGDDKPAHAAMDSNTHAHMHGMTTTDSVSPTSPSSNDNQHGCDPGCDCCKVLHNVVLISPPAAGISFGDSQFDKIRVIGHPLALYGSFLRPPTSFSL